MLNYKCSLPGLINTKFKVKPSLALFNKLDPLLNSGVTITASVSIAAYIMQVSVVTMVTAYPVHISGC